MEQTDGVGMEHGEPSRDGPPPTTRLTWTRAAWLIASGTTFRSCWPVAVIVGCVLSLINQGGRLISAPLEPDTILRVAANFAIPYVVSSIGYLRAPARREQ